MPKYAVLDSNNIVSNVIIADTLQTATTVSVPYDCILLGEGKMTDYWNGVNYVSIGEEGYPITE
jgi:hypothetical protein